MAKRKYARFGDTEVAYECTNKKCKWQGLDSEKAQRILDECQSVHICPECSNDEFYGLLELPERLKKTRYEKI